MLARSIIFDVRLSGLWAADLSRSPLCSRFRSSVFWNVRLPLRSHDLVASLTLSRNDYRIKVPYVTAESVPPYFVTQFARGEHRVSNTDSIQRRTEREGLHVPYLRFNGYAYAKDLSWLEWFCLSVYHMQSHAGIHHHLHLNQTTRSIKIP